MTLPKKQPEFQTEHYPSYVTPEFIALRDGYYALLRDMGFDEKEIIHKGSYQWNTDLKAISFSPKYENLEYYVDILSEVAEQDLRKQYWEKCAKLLDTTAIKTKTEKAVWAMYVKGIKVRYILEYLQEHKKEYKLRIKSQQQIYRMISRLRRRYIQVQPKKRLNKTNLV